MNSFNIAFFADSHIGYQAYSRTTPQGRNIREQDGYNALHETITQIIDSPEKIDAVIHGGDLFHTSQPSMHNIATVQHYLRVLSKNGIPFYGIAGNHDVTDNRSMLASVAVVNDPDKQIHTLYKPYQVYDISKKDGIFLHSVAHHGLSGDEAPKISPVTDGINLFTTHGAALDPKNAALMKCQDSPREQVIPPEMVLDDSFVIKLLGHFHSRYAVGGQELNTYYAGSSIRRGFSDEPGERGWLLVRIFPNGKVTIENKNISQRPQYDLPIIDAAGLSTMDVQDMVEAQVLSTRNDELDNQFNLKSAPIVRQKVINASRGVRTGIDRMHMERLTTHMLSWALKFENTSIDYNESMDKKEGENSPTLSRSSGKKADVKVHFTDWVSVSKRLAELNPEKQELVKKDSIRHLVKSSTEI